MTATAQHPCLKCGTYGQGLGGRDRWPKPGQRLCGSCRKMNREIDPLAWTRDFPGLARGERGGVRAWR